MANENWTLIFVLPVNIIKYTTGNFYNRGVFGRWEDTIWYLSLSFIICTSFHTQWKKGSNGKSNSATYNERNTGIFTDRRDTQTHKKTYRLSGRLRIRWLHPPTDRLYSNKGVLSKTLNCIWLWGSRFGDLGGVEYPFMTIIPRSTLTKMVLPV